MSAPVLEDLDLVRGLTAGLIAGGVALAGGAAVRLVYLMAAGRAGRLRWAAALALGAALAYLGWGGRAGALDVRSWFAARPAPAVDPGAADFTDSEAGFAVALPGPPEKGNERLFGRPFTLYQVVGARLVWTVGAAGPDQGRPPDLPGAVQELRRSFGGRVLSQSDITLALDGGEATEFEIETAAPRGYAAGRVLAVRGRTFVVLARGEQARLTDPAVRAYLESFRLVSGPAAQGRGAGGPGRTTGLPIVVIIAIVTLTNAICRHARPATDAATGHLVFRRHVALRVLALLGAVVPPVGMAVLSVVDTPKTGQDWLMVLALYALFAVLTLLLAWYVFRFTLVASPAGLDCRPPWGRRRFVPWEEVQSISYSRWHNKFVIHGPAGWTCALTYLQGWHAFLDVCEKHLPAAKLRPAREVYKILGRAMPTEAAPAEDMAPLVMTAIQPWTRAGGVWTRAGQ